MKSVDSVEIIQRGDDMWVISVNGSILPHRFFKEREQASLWAQKTWMSLLV